MEYFRYTLDAFVYSIIDAISIGLGIAILLRLIIFLIPIKNWDSLRNNGMAVAILLSAVLITFALISAATYFLPEIESITSSPASNP